MLDAGVDDGVGLYHMHGTIRGGFVSWIMLWLFSGVAVDVVWS